MVRCFSSSTPATMIASPACMVSSRRTWTTRETWALAEHNLESALPGRSCQSRWYYSAMMTVIMFTVSRTRMFCRVVVERLLASGAAEIVSLPFILRTAGRFFRVDHHPANRILYSLVHTYPPKGFASSGIATGKASRSTQRRGHPNTLRSNISRPGGPGKRATTATL